MSTNVENVYSSHAMYTTTCCGMGCTSTRIQILALEGTINYYYYTITSGHTAFIILAKDKKKKKKRRQCLFYQFEYVPQ